MGKTGIRVAAMLLAATLGIGASGVTTAAGSSLSSTGSPLSSDGPGSSGSHGSSADSAQERYLRQRVADGEITDLVAEGFLPELAELGYADELIEAGFVDELVEIGHLDPAVGIEESGVCPAVVAIVGRGSGQNKRLIPTRYARQAPWVSNGREAETWQSFFRAAERQYQLDHPGESLMKDVHVLGLPEELYPATHIRPRVDLSAAGSSAGAVLSSTLDGFLASIDQGTSGVQEAITRLEANTGCQPQYILAGYSQGAVALLPNEPLLAESGRLAGAIYLGNPLLTERHPSIIGTGTVGGGILHRIRPNVDRFAAIDNRVEYCIRGDLICDMGLPGLRAGSSRADGSSTGSVDALGSLIGGPHLTYFTDPDSPTADEVEVVRAFASWVDQVRY